MRSPEDIRSAGALAAAPGSLDGPCSAELARVAADLELGASTADALARDARPPALRTGRFARHGAAQPAGVGRRRGGTDAAARGVRCGSRPGRRRGPRRHNPGALHRPAGRRPAGWSGPLRRAPTTGIRLAGRLRARFRRDVGRGWRPAARRIRPDPPSREARQNDCGAPSCCGRPRSFLVCWRCSSSSRARRRSPRTTRSRRPRPRRSPPGRRSPSSTHDWASPRAWPGPVWRTGSPCRRCSRPSSAEHWPGSSGRGRGARGAQPARLDRRARACRPAGSWDPMRGSSAGPAGASERCGRGSRTRWTYSPSGRRPGAARWPG